MELPVLITLKFVTICLTTITLSTSLAHALEYPGKMRLDPNAYSVTQSIYYPGFTIAGIAEPLDILALIILSLLTPRGQTAFDWTVAALTALILLHAAYWILTHPVNKFWLKDQKVEGFGKDFFHLGSSGSMGAKENDPTTVWQMYRYRWEMSHIVRAVLATVAFIALLMTLLT
jgi:uncharacterized membrane protein